MSTINQCQEIVEWLQPRLGYNVIIQYAKVAMHQVVALNQLSTKVTAILFHVHNNSSAELKFISV